MTEGQDRLIDRKETAYLLGISPTFLRQAEMRGLGPRPYTKAGGKERGKVLYLESVVLRFIQNIPAKGWLMEPVEGEEK